MDKIESKVGYENFVRVFGLILTDRDPSFADYEGFENSKIFDKKRANVFYCDAYRSTQKASVENMNKQLRMFFPKGKYLSNFSKDDVKRINIFLNKRKLKSPYFIKKPFKSQLFFKFLTSFKIKI